MYIRTLFKLQTQIKITIITAQKGEIEINKVIFLKY